MAVRRVVEGERFRLSPLPRVALLLAPHSSGKRTAAVAAAQVAGVPLSDICVVPQPQWVGSDGDVSDASSGALSEPELSADMVRALVAWSRTAPRTPAGRLAVVRLGHVSDRVVAGRMRTVEWVASRRVQAMLLKLLEEPPEGSRFVLTSSGDGVLSTIMSRCAVSRAGALTVEGLAQVLDQCSDLPMSRCREIAALGSGQVRPALASASDPGTEKTRVRAVLGALARGDERAVTAAAPEWTQESLSLLRRWALECSSGRWRVFGPDDGPSSREFAWSVLCASAAFAGARPRVFLAALVSGTTRS